MSERRNRKGGNRRYLLPSSGMPEDGSRCDRRPGSSDQGHQEKPALIQEDEMGLFLPGFFLKRSSVGVSSGRRRTRCARRPFARVFAGSTPWREARGGCGKGGRKSQNACERADTPAHPSIGRSRIRAPRGLSEASAPNARVAGCRAWDAGPDAAWIECRLPPVPGIAPASVEPSAGRPPESCSLPWGRTPVPAGGWRGTAASRVLGRCLLFSYIILSATF
jgi:hypothetical protein